MMFVFCLDFLEFLQTAISETVSFLVEYVLKEIAGILISVIGTLLKDLLFTFWLSFFRLLLKGVYYTVRVLDVLSGMADVGIRSGRDVKSGGSLLGYFLQSSSVTRFFLGMTMVALALAFLFAIFRTAKTINDSVLEPEAKPISTVLRSGLRSAVSFMLIPFFCVCCLQLSAALLQEVKIGFANVETEEVGRTEFSDVLFEISAKPALKKGKTKADYENYWKNDQPYLDEEKTEEMFELREIDYFVGILSSLVILVILAGSCLAFARRIIEVLLLYLVAPFFAATIPLDDGKKFSGWRDRFIGSFFGCFGPVFAMRLYLIVIPIIAGDTLVISTNAKVNCIAKLCFIIGSAWAIYKSQDMITGLIDPHNRSAGESMAMVSGLAFMVGRKFGGKAKDMAAKSVQNNGRK